MIDSSSVVIGADIGATNLRVAVADAGGRILTSRRTSVAGVQDPMRVIAAMRDLSCALLGELALTPASLRAVGAGVPGLTDTDRGIVIATSYLMGWSNVPLRAHLEEAFSVPAAVDNDVNVAALGESRAGVAQPVDDFVFIAIGTGIGSGIVINRRLVRGSTWKAGEIGYMLVPGVSPDPVDASSPGAFEALAGGQGIHDQWQSRWSAERTTLPRELKATEIFDHARAGDALAAEVLHDAARLVSYVIHNLSVMLNIPLVVLGGSVGLHPVLGDEVRRLLDERADDSLPRVVTSGLGDQAQMIGALHLALDAAGSR